MARIKAQNEASYPWYVRWIFRGQRRNYGQALDSAKLWARSPRVFLGLSALFGALDRRSSPINPVLRALITVRVSQINWCPFCVDLNSASVLKRGGTESKLRDLERFRESAEFSEKEKAALAYAEAMTIGNDPVDEAVFREVKRHFDEDAIVELTGLIGFQNLSSRFNGALDVKPQGFCRVAPQPRRDSVSKAGEAGDPVEEGAA